MRRLVARLIAAAALLALATPAQALPVAVVASVIGSGFLATVVTAVLNIGLSLALGALLGPKVKKPERQASVTTLQLGEQPRMAIVGKAATAGTLVDAFNFGDDPDHTKREVLVIALADHRCHKLVGFYVNDQYHDFTGDGNVDGYDDNLKVFWRPGTLTQVVPQNVTAHGPGWTANDNLAGVCMVSVEYHADKPGAENPYFPAGRPSFLFVLEGAYCYDPRKDSTVAGGSGAHRWNSPATWEYSDNPIVCRYNWVRGFYACDRIDQPDQLLVGRGLSAAEAPPENVAVYANICDELVNLAAGGTEKRYRIGGLIKADDPFIETEEDFAAACGGVIIQPGGSVEIEPGHAKSAVFSFTDDDIVAGTSITFSRFRSETDEDWKNTVIPRYVEPSQKWVDHAAPIRRVYADVIADGKPREDTLALTMVTSGTQAQRCGEIARRLGRLTTTAGLTLGPRFAAVEAGDVVVWTSLRRTGGLPVQFRVESYELDEKWQNTLTLREIASSVYSWTTADEITSGATATQQPAPPAGAAPGATAWSLAGTTLDGASGSMPALVITGASDRDAIDTVKFEWRLHVAGQADDAGWAAASSELPNVTRKVISGVGPAAQYDAAVSYSVRGIPSPRRILGPVTAGTVAVPWSTGITGPGKPADNAGTTLSLTVIGTATGAAATGNTYSKPSGSGTANSAAFSPPIVGPSFVACKAASGQYTVIGLDADNTNYYYGTSKYNLLFDRTSGNFGLYGPGGVSRGGLVAGTTASWSQMFCEIDYDNRYVHARIDGKVVASIAAPGGQKLWPKWFAYDAGDTYTYMTTGVFNDASLAPVTNPLGVVNVVVQGDTLTNLTGADDYNASVVGLRMAGACFVSASICTDGDFTMLALDDDNTNSHYASQSAILFYQRSTGVWILYGGNTGATLDSGTIATNLTGDATLAYDGTKFLPYIAGVLRGTGAAAAPTGQAFYPKWYAYSAGSTLRDMDAGVFTNQAAANLALAELAAIADDDVLNAGSDKRTIKQLYDAILGDQAGLDTQATNYGITTEKAAYDNDIAALTAHLAGLTPAWDNPDVDTPIVAATFKAKFTAVSNSKTALVTKIATSSTSKEQIVVTVGASTITLPADSGGTLVGTSPYFTVQASVTKGGGDKTADAGTIWGLTASPGITASIGDGTGGTTKGQILITAMSGASETLAVSCSVGGVAQPSQNISVQKQNAPAQPPSTSSASTSSFTEPTSTSTFTAFTSTLTVALAAGQSLRGKASISGYSNALRLKWQYSPAGANTWSDFAAAVTGTATTYYYNSVQPANVVCNQVKSGLSAGSYDTRLVAERVTGGTYSFGTASMEAS